MSTSSALQRNAVTQLGGGPSTVVLAHGFGSDQTAWGRIAPTLAESHRLVLFDHVGAGRSDISAYSPRRYQTMHAYAADLLEVLAELDVRDAIFIGHSMSASIGLLAALEEPERFRAMIFMNASPRYLNDEGYHGGFDQADVDALYEAMASNYQAWVSGIAPVAMGTPGRPELAKEFAATLGGVRPDIGLSMARMVYQSDIRADLGALEIPTVLVQTRHDAFVPLAVGEYLAEHIPRSTLHIIDTSGHLPHVSAPRLVLEAIEPVIARVASGSTLGRDPAVQ